MASDLPFEDVFPVLVFHAACDSLQEVSVWVEEKNRACAVADCTSSTL